MEIATHPPGAALDDFLWRISIAEIDRDGPFSPFPGIDRIIVVLEGEGMRMRGRALDAKLTTPFVPHAFSGDESIECTLIAGRTRDFNAMFRRGKARGTIAIVRDAAAEFAPTDFRLAYAATGNHECILSEGASRMLAPEHSLLIDGGGDGEASLTIRPLATGAVALVVSIDCR